LNRKLIGAEWQRARSSLGASRALLDTGHPEDAITRSYFSVFHAARDEHDRATAFLSRIRQYLLTKGLRENEIPALPQR
jgi:hypothetical protein